MLAIKANTTLGFLRRNFYSCPQDVKEAVDKGLVYWNSVWNPTGLVLQEELEACKSAQLDS